MTKKSIGTVKWFNTSKGFGVIERKDGPDAFVHYSSIEQEGFKTLKEGQQVKFSLERSLRGFQAEKIEAA